MTTTFSMARRLLLVVLVVAQVAIAEEPSRFQRLFNHYNSIRAALAADTIAEIPYHAEQLGVLARTLAGEVQRSKDKDSATIAKELLAISNAARQVGYSTDLKAARTAFAELSRALVAYRGVANVKDPIVVFCPLHNRIWLQRSGEKIGNPYLGKDGATCGETLKLRAPGWLPSRPPLNPAGGPSPGDVNPWGGR
ncbi:MAG TPA: DUF3347 domain-containing protein [Acidobacteria bacterium]|nr:DUF3347 domain-containing protein [Acidobacteriota bacterium]